LRRTFVPWRTAIRAIQAQVSTFSSSFSWFSHLLLCYCILVSFSLVYLRHFSFIHDFLLQFHRANHPVFLYWFFLLRGTKTEGKQTRTKQKKKLRKRKKRKRNELESE
jgi:hypothetical protein